MTLMDYAKAAGWATVILVLNLLLASLAIMLAVALENAEATPELIATWTAPIGGFLISFLLLQWVTDRNPSRPWLPFALVVFAAYLLIDLALGLAMAGTAVFEPLLALSMMMALAGCVIGAWTSRPAA